MKKILIMLTALLSLSLGAAVAQADHAGAGFAPPLTGSQQAIVSGTVVSTSGDTFLANAYVLTPGSGYSASAPITTQVTITTNSSTTFRIDGNTQATIANLAPNQAFYASFSGDPSEGLTALIANPAISVLAFTPQTHHIYVAGTIISIGTDGTSFDADAYILTRVQVVCSG